MLKGLFLASLVYRLKIFCECTRTHFKVSINKGCVSATLPSHGATNNETANNLMFPSSFSQLLSTSKSYIPLKFNCFLGFIIMLNCIWMQVKESHNEKSQTILPASYKLQSDLLCMAQRNIHDNQDCSSWGVHGEARSLMVDLRVRRLRLVSGAYRMRKKFYFLCMYSHSLP